MRFIVRGCWRLSSLLPLVRGHSDQMQIEGNDMEGSQLLSGHGLDAVEGHLSTRDTDRKGNMVPETHEEGEVKIRGIAPPRCLLLAGLGERNVEDARTRRLSS